MNLSPLGKEIDDRLEKWADYYAVQGDGGLGFPKVNMLWKIMHGTAQIRSHGGYMDGNNEAEEMERFMVELVRYNHLLAAALYAKYLGYILKPSNEGLKCVKRIARNAHMVTIARELDISVRTLDARITNAKNNLAGFLVGMRMQAANEKIKPGLIMQTA
jgi:DNA-binding CsgD family transcriptional regulator